MALANDAAMTPNVGGDVKKDIKAENESFRNNGASEREAMSEDQKQLEGSASDKVAFVCALGNPAKPQKRVENGKPVDSYQVVGFRFNLSESMNIPVAPLKHGCKSLIDVEGLTEVNHPAGMVDLNLLEMGAFISKIEFAGTFTGGDKPVMLSAKVSKDRDEPLPILKLADSKNGFFQLWSLSVCIYLSADIRNLYKVTMKQLLHDMRSIKKGT